MKAMILFASASLVAVSGLAQPPTPPPAPAPRILKTATSGSYIGVMIQEIDSERAKALKLPGEYGVEITRVDADSPAEKAGLKPGDVVMEYNGQRVEGIEEFSRMVRETPAGRDAKLDVIRGGAPQSIAVKVGSRRAPQAFTFATPAPAALIPRYEVRMPDIPRSFMSWRSSALGVDCEALQGQLADYFGVKEGVLVRSVFKNSAAEKAGIKAGDVITRVDDSHVAAPADISSRIHSLHGKQFPVVVMRDRKEMTLNVTVDQEDHGDMWMYQLAPRDQF